MIKRINIFQVLFFISIIWNEHLVVFSQQEPEKPDKREVILIKGDTTIKTYVMIGETEIIIDNDLTYAWYSKNNIYVNQGGYSGKLLHGSHKKYFNGKLILKGKYQVGLKSGTWKCWHSNSVLKSVENYKTGIKNGLFSYYDAEGKLIRKLRYKKGLMDGGQLMTQGDSIVTKKFKKGSEILPKAKDECLKNKYDTLNVK